MIRRTAMLLAATSLLLAALGSSHAIAAPAAAWQLSMTPIPTNFAPGASPRYRVTATNVGEAPSAGLITLEATLPNGLAPLVIEAVNGDPKSPTNPSCLTALPTITCTTAEPVRPGRVLLLTIQVSVPPGAPEETLLAKASIEGGGASQKVTTSFPTPITASFQPFDFLPGFSAPLTNGDGTPTAQAGSHPYQATVNLGFPTENPGDGLTGAGHPRDIRVDLPRGLIGNPAATPVLCTEIELTSEASPGCPDASQVGVIDVTTLVLGEQGTAIITSNLYAMVSPPGSPATFAFNAAGVGIFIHLIAGIRTDGDYGAFAASHDVLALGSNPIFNVQTQLWGDPSGEAHDGIRGEKCRPNGGSCPVPHQKTAFLTTPTDCPGHPIAFKAFADSWEEPEVQHEALYESADLTNAPVSMEECGALAFEPEIKARPTTNLTDSPTGLDVELHQPQETDLEGLSTAALKDATVTLPPGMVVNPSQADGLGACSPSQIGMLSEVGETHPRFSKTPAACPDAAKIGTVQASSPLLVQRNEEHKVQLDPETGQVIPEPLQGSIYIAQPFQNPFASLVAVYLTIEDEKTGILAKLAGEGHLDPATGQISTRFEENPELPIEDVAVHLFAGNRAPLITPPTCAKDPHTTIADLTPWSGPESAVQVTDSFQSTTAPGGGPCPGSEAQMPNAPSFSAGTLSPQAGAFSPLLFKLTRPDGSQRLTKIEATMPPGLSARLAGVGQCSEAQIAKARSREAPNQGALEQADPSCPATALLGTVTVGAGAGPTPYFTKGNAYLAGPYKGAPLSLAIVTPAVAGPFDLGVVVVRTALYLDPETARVRAVSDPLPTILQGIPLDVRSVALRADRPSFTLNPTSCDEMSFAGQAATALGAIAPLAERFQVGGCAALPFKPKLTTRLFGPIHRGGHPRLRSVFTAKPGEANTARIVFALPHSEFIDQAHFRTICTRVQYAANQCPAGSIYGHVTATTPLLDYSLEGPIYLRSSSHKLPDVVAALRGPPSQPIALDLVGRVDSVNGGIRTTFEVVPDAPVTKAVVALQGGKKGLFQNSTNICKGAHRATLKLDGQNGKVHDTRPLLKAQCGKGGKGKGKKAKGKGGGKARR